MAYIGLWLAIGALIMFWGLWERSPEEPLRLLLPPLAIVAFLWPVGIVAGLMISFNEMARYWRTRK